MLGLRLGFSDQGNDPADTTTRQAYDLIADGFGPGFNGPLLAVAEVPAGTTPDELQAVTAAIAATPGVAIAAPPLTDDPADSHRRAVAHHPGDRPAGRSHHRPRPHPP